MTKYLGLNFFYFFFFLVRLNFLRRLFGSWFWGFRSMAPTSVRSFLQMALQQKGHTQEGVTWQVWKPGSKEGTAMFFFPVFLCVRMCVHVCMCVHVSMCVHVCMCGGAYACLCACMSRPRVDVRSHPRLPFHLVGWRISQSNYSHWLACSGDPIGGNNKTMSKQEQCVSFSCCFK